MRDAVIAKTLTETDHNLGISSQDQEMFFDQDSGSDFLRLTASGTSDWIFWELQGRYLLGHAVLKDSTMLRRLDLGGIENWPPVEQADPAQTFLDFVFYPGREIRRIRSNQGVFQFLPHMPPKDDRCSPQRRRYATRLKALQELARNEEIDPVNPESEKDFLNFLATRGFPVRRASLALLDDGTLGATWRNDQWRLGLRFCGGGQVEYVLLDRTDPPEGATGKSNLENFEVDCNRLDLRALLAE